MRWPRERIRKEIRQLDSRTGLNGLALSIRFSDDTETLGSFAHSKSQRPLYFTFSRHFFEDPSFTDEEAIDTIRHEYAHFMKCVRYPDQEEDVHGPLWQRCCREIGAVPEACHDLARRYTASRVQHRLLLQDVAEVVEIGQIITHPRYGDATITHIRQRKGTPGVSLTFPNGRVRKCTLDWLLENCL